MSCLNACNLVSHSRGIGSTRWFQECDSRFVSCKGIFYIFRMPWDLVASCNKFVPHCFDIREIRFREISDIIIINILAIVTIATTSAIVMIVIVVGLAGDCYRIAVCREGWYEINEFLFTTEYHIFEHAKEHFHRIAIQIILLFKDFENFLNECAEFSSWLRILFVDFLEWSKENQQF